MFQPVAFAASNNSWLIGHMLARWVSPHSPSGSIRAVSLCTYM